MCTVVIRRVEGQPVRVLALRDEDTGRPFDDPDRWWPEQPGVVGGRDRIAGGTWCATDVATGVTALVLNRPERRLAAPGAASRGLLPLLAVAYGPRWADHVDVSGMASFALLLVGPDVGQGWSYDGEVLHAAPLPFGTTMTTSGGAEDRRVSRHLDAFRTAGFPDDWRALVTGSPPADDRSALVVRHTRGERVFGTVFGQLMVVAPGAMQLSCSRQPWLTDRWQDTTWSSAD